MAPRLADVGFLREPKVEGVVGVVLGSIALGFTVSPVHSLSLAILFWALAALVVVVAGVNGWKRRGRPAKQQGGTPLSRRIARQMAHTIEYGLATPSEPVSEPEDPEFSALKAAVNRLNIGRQLDRDESLRLRKSLIRQGYALLSRLEADPMSVLRDVMKLPNDLRVWVRTARGCVRAELPHLQDRLPDDEPLDSGDTYAKVGLVNAYLELLRF